MQLAEEKLSYVFHNLYMHAVVRSTNGSRPANTCCDVDGEKVPQRTEDSSPDGRHRRSFHCSVDAVHCWKIHPGPRFQSAAGAVRQRHWHGCGQLQFMHQLDDLRACEQRVPQGSVQSVDVSTAQKMLTRELDLQPQLAGTMPEKSQCKDQCKGSRISACKS
jgi:hypothetical protein